MVEISLSSYQAELDELSTARAYDDVSAHARQILRHYPKNLRAYHHLGGALIGLERWAAAVDVLRRFLSAQPRDFSTQARLAQAYQQLGYFDRAVWHNERALDLKPKDIASQERIRALYRQHRREQITSWQLTPAAQAQAHIRSNLLTEALASIEQSLQQMPARLDLQLLRAQTLWLYGRRLNAAECAVDILKQLPYAIDANRIMAELWLAERRPSDARAYLQRIEELDPALAHQLASGKPAPSNLLRLDKLEDQEIVRQQPQLVNPEWLAGDGLVALFGIEDEEADANSLPNWLPVAELEQLYGQWRIGESVAEVLELAHDAVPPPPPIEAAQPASHSEPEPAAEAPSEKWDSGLLDALDDGDEDDSWDADIEPTPDEPAADVADDGGEYAREGDEARAPWLAAALHEAGDINPGDEGSLQQLHLLDRSGDTEPIDSSDVDEWLQDVPETYGADSVTDENPPQEDFDAPQPAAPARSWLGDVPAASAPASADAFDEWQGGLDNDEDGNPYTDWLDEDSMGTGEGAYRPSAAPSSDHSNAALPGLDRENTQSTDDAEPYQPTTGRSADFGWVKDLVEEETSEAPALPHGSDLYFRFSKPPSWLSALQGALNSDTDVDALYLDKLTFDEPFAFYSPTDSAGTFSIDADTERLEDLGLGLDDYFDMETPTERTVAIDLNAEMEALDALELNLDLDKPTDQLPAVALDDDIEHDSFEQLGGAAPPRWLGLGDDGADIRRRRDNPL